jgi:catechol 2,3-dioxygenase-like lactoylglutathione lyase family enzyme
MLAQCPLIAFIPTKDAARARLFYEDLLGLRFVSDDAFALVMDANGTMIRIVRVGDFNPAPFTILGWHVEDIARTVAEMTSKGIQFARYSFLQQSQEGIWSSPDGNTLSLSEH